MHMLTHMVTFTTCWFAANNKIIHSVLETWRVKTCVCVCEKHPDCWVPRFWLVTMKDGICFFAFLCLDCGRHLTASCSSETDFSFKHFFLDFGFIVSEKCSLLSTDHLQMYISQQCWPKKRKLKTITQMQDCTYIWYFNYFFCSAVFFNNYYYN